MMARLNKQDLQEVLVWGLNYQSKCEELGIKWDETEIRMLKKFGALRDKAWSYPKGRFEENHFRHSESALAAQDVRSGKLTARCGKQAASSVAPEKAF